MPSHSSEQARENYLKTENDKHNSPTLMYRRGEAITPIFPFLNFLTIRSEKE